MRSYIRAWKEQSSASRGWDSKKVSKSEIVPLLTMKAYSKSGAVPPIIFNLGIRWQ